MWRAARALAPRAVLDAYRNDEDRRWHREHYEKLEQARDKPRVTTGAGRPRLVRARKRDGWAR